MNNNRNHNDSNDLIDDLVDLGMLYGPNGPLHLTPHGVEAAGLTVADDGVFLWDGEEIGLEDAQNINEFLQTVWYDTRNGVWASDHSLFPLARKTIITNLTAAVK